MKKTAVWMAVALMAGSVMAGNLIDGTCDTGITNAPVTPLTASHADKGWYASHSGQYSNNLGRIYRVPNVNNTGFRSAAQVINNAKTLTGSQPVMFDYDYAGATGAGNVAVSLFAWNSSLTGAQVDNANQDDNTTGTSILLSKVEVGTDAASRSGTYSNSVDFGAGYDYIAIAVTIQYLGASGVGYIDNVQIGAQELPTRGTTFLIK
jgi:hypothetical protein